MTSMSRAMSKVRGFLEVIQFDNWLQLVISRLFFRPSIDIYYYRGLEILVDHAGGDVNGIRACLVTPMYRQFLDKMSLPKSGVNVVDLGANSGGFSLLLKAEGLEVAKLVAAELNPQTYRRLVLNLERNFRDTEIVVLNEGIFSNSGSVELYLGRGSTGDSIDSSATQNQHSKRYLIKTTTLNDFFENSVGECIVSLCKIDIEGAEWDLFFNPGSDRIRQCENVLMEIHAKAGREPGQLVARLANFGFELSGTKADVYWFTRNWSV